MTKIILALCVVVGFAQAQMQMFQSVPVEQATILQKGKNKMYCPDCGMNLPKFYKTTHAIKLKDGSVNQVCSIHCLVEEMELTVLRGKADQVEQILVVDVPSLKYVDAKTAHYVVGSAKKGTMTATSKYAFADKADAQNFIAQNGGTLSSYEEAYNTALADFYKDMGMLKAKRSSSMYKMGKMLSEKSCDTEKLNAMTADSRGALKALIRDSGVCKLEAQGMKLDSQLQAIMLYLLLRSLILIMIIL